MYRSTRVGLLITVSVALGLCTACIERRKPEPPIAKIEPKTNTLHGENWTDNYYWLRDKTNPEVINYLKEENAYTDAVMAPTKELQKKLFDEMVGRIKETDLSVPVQDGDYYYYSRTEEGQQYNIDCRKKGSLDAPEEVILDQNQLAAGHGFWNVGVFDVSPNQDMLAYSVDTTGAEAFTLHFKNLKSDKLLQDEIPNTSTEFAWATDNKHVFYTTLDDAKRSYKLYRHELGTNYREDVLVYQEPDQMYDVSIRLTKDKQYLLMDLESNTTSEIRYVKADKPEDRFQVLKPREHEVQYAVYSHDKTFYIVTNEEAKNFKVMTTSAKDPAVKNWTTFIPGSDSVFIDGLDMFKNYVVIYERLNGLQEISVVDPDTRKAYSVEFPEKDYTYDPGENPDYKSKVLRYTYSSLITPRTVYDYHMDDHTEELLKQYEVLGGYDKNQYTLDRIYATASDGVKIPISIVFKKGMVLNGQNPFFLYGYGSYGLTIDPYFSSTRLSLLDRGFVFAIAHIRGSGEMGRAWYEEGKLLNKRHTFTDFISCAQYVIDQKYTNPEKLVIEGASAGGLLIGAVLNMRPDLFKAAIADVPFVDVLNTMLDPTLPLTVTEYEEWGNPNEKQYFDYIKSYAPYENVTAQKYPNILVETSLNDTRVSYWEPAKWVAKLRALKTDHNLLLLKTNMDAGHFGSMGRYQYIHDIAFEYSFLLYVLGMNK
ncbi:MAG TPA: S9 family peptidase [candidate division Zixibacteria bacterium]|nr:S9 family peptidase [candidate division Zixibacteria bacterium]